MFFLLGQNGHTILQLDESSGNILAYADTSPVTAETLVWIGGNNNSSLVFAAGNQLYSCQVNNGKVTVINTNTISPNHLLAPMCYSNNCVDQNYVPGVLLVDKTSNSVLWNPNITQGSFHTQPPLNNISALQSEGTSVLAFSDAGIVKYYLDFAGETQPSTTVLSPTKSCVAASGSSKLCSSGSGTWNISIGDTVVNQFSSSTILRSVYNGNNLLLSTSGFFNVQDLFYGATYALGVSWTAGGGGSSWYVPVENRPSGCGANNCACYFQLGNTSLSSPPPPDCWVQFIGGLAGNLIKPTDNVQIQFVAGSNAGFLQWFAAQQAGPYSASLQQCSDPTQKPTPITGRIQGTPASFQFLYNNHSKANVSLQIGFDQQSFDQAPPFISIEMNTPGQYGIYPFTYMAVPVSTIAVSTDAGRHLLPVDNHPLNKFNWTTIVSGTMDSYFVANSEQYSIWTPGGVNPSIKNFPAGFQLQDVYSASSATTALLSGMTKPTTHILLIVGAVFLLLIAVVAAFNFWRKKRSQ